MTSSPLFIGFYSSHGDVPGDRIAGGSLTVSCRLDRPPGDQHSIFSVIMVDGQPVRRSPPVDQVRRRGLEVGQHLRLDPGREAPPRTASVMCRDPGITLARRRWGTGRAASAAGGGPALVAVGRRASRYWTRNPARWALAFVRSRGRAGAGRVSLHPGVEPVDELDEPGCRRRARKGSSRTTRCRQ